MIRPVSQRLISPSGGQGRLPVTSFSAVETTRYSAAAIGHTDHRLENWNHRHHLPTYWLRPTQLKDWLLTDYAPGINKEAFLQHSVGLTVAGESQDTGLYLLTAFFADKVLFLRCLLLNGFFIHSSASAEQENICGSL